MEDRTDELYEINKTLDDIRPLFYNLLKFPQDSYCDEKDRAKRELLFALQDLLNKAENL